MLNEELLTPEPDQNTITITNTLGGTQFTTEVHIGASPYVSVTKITTLTVASLDDSAKAIEREQQEIGRAILELLTGR